ncbi:hypothetical protein SBA6_60003 [Candidatus Sulfopaludibacter sp. SbA6]|nr:hypothetical protein SBA6_60003 [Candidatus Sulfopaludibacter sp. SbA6]
MDSERGKQVDHLLQAALERPPAERAEFLRQAERAEFLRQACAGDEALEREVRSLLTFEPHVGNFLESPAMEVAARDLGRHQTPARATPRKKAAIPRWARTSPITALSESWAAAGWGWFIKPRTPGSSALWLSSFCPANSPASRMP